MIMISPWPSWGWQAKLLLLSPLHGYLGTVWQHKSISLQRASVISVGHTIQVGWMWYPRRQFLEESQGTGPIRWDMKVYVAGDLTWWLWLVANDQWATRLEVRATTTLYAGSSGPRQYSLRGWGRIREVVHCSPSMIFVRVQYVGTCATCNSTEDCISTLWCMCCT